MFLLHYFAAFRRAVVRVCKVRRSGRSGLRLAQHRVAVAQLLNADVNVAQPMPSVSFLPLPCTAHFLLSTILVSPAFATVAARLHTCTSARPHCNNNAGQRPTNAAQSSGPR